MKTRFVSAVIFSFVTLAWVLPARADFLAAFVHSVVRDTKRRHCWPKPFVRPSRYDVRAPLAKMVANGWRFQNYLGDHHFDVDTGQLTEAGRMKVRWICTQAPMQHRVIYVHAADEPEVTAGRIDQVQQLAARLVREGELPPVFETHRLAPRSLAERVDIVGRAAREGKAAPAIPMLPETKRDSGGGGE